MLCVWQGMVHPTDAWVSSQSSVHTARCAKSSGLEALADDGARWMGRCWGAEPRCLGGECDLWLVPLPPQTTCQSARMQRSLSLDPAFPPRSRASLCAMPHHASPALWPSWLLSIPTLSHLALLTLPCCPEAHLFWFLRASLGKKNETKAVLPGKTSLHFCPNSLLLVQAIGMLLNDSGGVRSYGRENWKIVAVIKA